MNKSACQPLLRIWFWLPAVLMLFCPQGHAQSAPPQFKLANVLRSSALCLAISHDNHYLATGNEYFDVTIWNLDSTGQAHESLRLHKGKRWLQAQDVVTAFGGGTAAPSCSLSFSPDGQYIAESSNRDSRVRIWKLATASQVPVLTGRGIIGGHVLFNPDGRNIATVRSIYLSPLVPWRYPRSVEVRREVVLWDTATGKEKRSFPSSCRGGGRTWVLELAFSPDGRYLAATCEEEESLSPSWTGTRVDVWEVGSGKLIRTLLRGHLILPVGSEFGRPETYYALPRFWDPANGEEGLDPPVMVWPWSSIAHGTYVVGFGRIPAKHRDKRRIQIEIGDPGGDNTVWAEFGLWDTAVGTESFPLEKEQGGYKISGDLWSFIVSPDGQAIAASINGHVAIWRRQ